MMNLTTEERPEKNAPDLWVIVNGLKGVELVQSM